MLYDFFEMHLTKGDVALGKEWPEADSERKAVDTVVIHHTGSPPGMGRMRLSAIELIRLYAPYFIDPKSKRDLHLKGQPVASGHFCEGKQVFWPYHWIVRSNGRAERLLLDNEIGWHAGDWDVNCRSVAITLDNDYENQRPSTTELNGIAEIINDHYGQASLKNVVGHREVNARTSCPSNLFLTGSINRGWKDEILHVLKRKTLAFGSAA